MINISPATLVLQIIHFLILAWILNRLLFRPVLNIIEARSRHIEDEKKKLYNLEEETRELVEKCALIEREARKKAGKQSDELKKEANNNAEEIFSGAREEIMSIREKADREIGQKIEEARMSLRSQSEIIAQEIIEKITGRRFAH